MSTYTFYLDENTGKITTLSDWQRSGKNGKLKVLKLVSEDLCSPSNRVFPGWDGDVKDGEEYHSEWIDYARDSEGNEYKITWQFPVIKGCEPEDDGEWPWDDDQYIYSVDAL